MAQLLTGSDILVAREDLPKLEPGEYYWTDLEGLSVETLSGVVLGTVAYLYLNAGHTNMVIKGTRERHIPFMEPDFVKEISLESQKIIVDWDPEL
jgi:16S rRNA processing protein RimM